MWSADPTRYLTHWVDTFQLTKFVKSSYSSSVSLPLSSNQSGHCPLTLIHQRGIYTCRSCAHWMFFVFRTILYNLYKLLCVKTPREQFQKYANQPIWSKSQRSMKLLSSV